MPRFPRSLRLCIAALTLGCLSIATAHAANRSQADPDRLLIPVTRYVPIDVPTIQGAINASANGDTVVVLEGTYFENIDYHGKRVVVRSAGGPVSTAIDGGNVGPCVKFVSGENASAMLEGFTLQRGLADASVLNRGGGICVGTGGSPLIIGNVITRCDARTGGGIASTFASPLIIGNQIYGNHADNLGAGIYITGYGTAQVGNNVIQNNVCTGGYAGICLNDAGSPRIVGNQIIGNQAGSGDGGGIGLFNLSDPLIFQNLIIGNVAARGGGIAFFTPSGARGPFIVQNTIVGNLALEGPAIFALGYHEQSKIANNILVADSAQSALFCSPLAPAPPIIRYNDGFAQGADPFGGSAAGLGGTAGNIVGDPRLASSPFDLHLLADSPAIDAGNNAEPELTGFDFEGHDRIVDGDFDGTATVDMGAFERPAIRNRPPVAHAGGPYSGEVGDSLLFSSNGSSDPDGDAITYAWDFGDGFTGASPETTHAYTAVGTYRVILTVSDGHLSSADTTEATITPSTAPLAARAFVVGGNRVTRLRSGKPSTCIRIEPVADDFSLEDVVPSSIYLADVFGGYIPASSAELLPSRDRDRNGVLEFEACFAKSDLRVLFSHVGGAASVSVVAAGQLTSGRTFIAYLEISVTGGPADSLAMVREPNRGETLRDRVPAPVGPGAELVFELAADGPVRVRVFDVSGRLVRTPLDLPWAGAGAHRVPLFDRAGGGAQGLYLYRVETPRRDFGGKFVHIR